MKTSKFFRSVLPLFVGIFAILFMAWWSLKGQKEKNCFVDKVSGRREGCVFCHSGVKGFSPPHNPQAIGWFSCHNGQPFSLNKKEAHQEMILVPGNLPQVEKTCGTNNCHTWRELMVDGNNFNHQEEQVEISCEDCHFSTPPDTTNRQNLSAIDLKILSVRKIDYHEPAFVTTQKTGRSLLNVILDKNGKPFFTAKNFAKEYHPQPPLPICSRGISGHERLTCHSCHTAWAPQCISCHTRFEWEELGIDHLTGKKVRGRWVELSADFYADPPVLGVLETKSGGKITTFIPGMILTIEKGEMTAGKGNNGSALFRRLFAPTAAHTTMREGRPCQSCHNESLALGYGRGKLFLRKAASGRGSWHFKLYYDLRPEDQLPYDAWIGFLQTCEEMSSTRSNARHLNVAEQKRVLAVGVCLTCHKANPKNLVRIYSVFRDALKRTTKQCLLLK
ncbi:MAG: hypothetical protein ACE5GL_10005 [Calditrichia bacterium]